MVLCYRLSPNAVCIFPNAAERLIFQADHANYRNGNSWLSRKISKKLFRLPILRRKWESEGNLVKKCIFFFYQTTSNVLIVFCVFFFFDPSHLDSILSRHASLKSVVLSSSSIAVRFEHSTTTESGILFRCRTRVVDIALLISAESSETLPRLSN